MTLRAVIFDLGNVLVFHDNAKLIHTMARAFGASASQVEHLLGDGLWEAVNCGDVDDRQLLDELNRRCAAAVPWDEFAALWNCHFTVNQSMVDLAQSLVGQVKLALLSNTNALHFEYLLPRLDVLQNFDTLILSYREKVAKPSPTIFHRVLERLAVAPNEALFFDDVPAYVAAARRLGIGGEVFVGTEDCRAALSRCAG